ncbi:NifB/NifX family molybdenum-iron cluster-binding protein [Bacteroidales bacterium]
MKVAITSTGNSPDSMLDPRFGRCSWFVIYDTITGSIEFLPNPFRNEEENVAEKSINLVNCRKVEKIISGEYGEKNKLQLDSLNIQLIVLPNCQISIQEIINLLNH